MTVKLLSRDAILARPILTEDVSVSEWGGTVRVRGLDAKQRDEFEAGLIETVGKSQRVTMRNARRGWPRSPSWTKAMRRFSARLT